MNNVATTSTSTDTGASPLSMTPDLPGTDGTFMFKGITLEELACQAALPIACFQMAGWLDTAWSGNPAVEIPYLDEAGELVSRRFRSAWSGLDIYRWKKDMKPALYGLIRVGDCRRAAYALLVGSELDALTAWQFGIPCIALPDATGWKESWGVKLKAVPTIHVVVADDLRGQLLVEQLSMSDLAERVRVIRLAPGCPDLNTLYQDDPDSFATKIEALRRAAPKVGEFLHQPSDEEAALAERASAELATCPYLLWRFAETAQNLGLAGEDRAAKLLYLAVTTRLLDHPVTVVMKGVSSSGKSYVVKQVLRFFPESAYYALSAMSDKVLTRMREPLSHRFLVIYEAEGAKGQTLEYFIRSLISEGHIKYETLVETPNGWEPETFIKEGPTGLILTTTRVSLHPENETRMISVPTDDSDEQTRRVFLASASEESRNHEEDERVLAPWLALQTWLLSGPREVTIPYADSIAMGANASAPRLRRDFPNVLTLVRAHALLHRASRDTDERGRIVASIEDYASVFSLVSDLVSEGVERAVSKEVRVILDLVAIMGQEDSDGVTIGYLARRLRRHRTTVVRQVQKALQAGYLTNLNEGKGKRRYLLVEGDYLPDHDEIVLPRPEEVAAAFARSSAADPSVEETCTCAPESGIEGTPPPPVGGETFENLNPEMLLPPGICMPESDGDSPQNEVEVLETTSDGSVCK